MSPKFACVPCARAGDRQLLPQILRLNAIVAWSFRVLLHGTWPRSDHRGVPFTGWRAAKAGRQLADGWTAAYVQSCSAELSRTIPCV
eukprot:3966393-Alexandrium_andersonii.AAC.1